MDVGSTLSDLAERFTNDQQVIKLEKFIEDTPLSEPTKKRLNIAVNRSRTNIEWDHKRLQEIKKYFTGGTAPVHYLSLTLLILSMFVYFMFN